MADQFGQWISVPAFSPDNSRVDHWLLRHIAIAVLVLDSLVLLALLLVMPEAISWAAVEIGTVALGALASLVALRHQRPHVSAALLVFVTWLLAAAVTLGNGGFGSPFMPLFLIPVLLSFLLMDTRTRLLIFACTLLFVVTIWIGDIQSLLPDYYVNPTLIAIGNTAILVLLMWLFGTTAANIRQVRDRAAQQEKLLQERETELRQQTTALEVTRDAYESLIENSIQSVLVWQNGGAVFANKAHAQLTGYAIDELRQMEDGLKVIIHPDDYALVRDRIAARLAGSLVPSRYEVRIIRKDGAVRWVEIISARITYQGQPALQTTSVDITERRQSQDTLQASEALFRSLTENAPIGVFMTTASGIIRYVNDELCRFVGWQASELVAQPLTLLLDAHNEANRTAFLQTICHGEARTMDRFIVQARRKDGTVFWAELSTNMIQDASGANNIVGLFLDITERRDAAQKQLELAVEKEKVTMLQQFIGNISHDLKTPLTIINASLYLLDKASDSRYRAEKLDEIRIQTALLGTMIQDLLAMSRLDQGAVLEREPVSLESLAYQTVRQFQLRLESKNQTAVVIVETTIPPVLGDSGELKRLMCNLFENAINYTPAGGQITCTLAASDDSVRLTVADTGMGINSADLPHVFERFYRSADARALLNSGSGLGLAIARKIVELHAGTITVESQLHAGTAFHVSLPLAQVAASVG
jgi:PAS domain S-box-containing protein